MEIEKWREFAWVKLFDAFADVVGKDEIKERLLLDFEVCVDEGVMLHVTILGRQFDWNHSVGLLFATVFSGLYRLVTF